MVDDSLHNNKINKNNNNTNKSNIHRDNVHVDYKSRTYYNSLERDEIPNIPIEQQQQRRSTMMKLFETASSTAQIRPEGSSEGFVIGTSPEMDGRTSNSTIGGLHMFIPIISDDDDDIIHVSSSSVMKKTKTKEYTNTKQGIIQIMYTNCSMPNLRILIVATIISSCLLVVSWYFHYY